MKKQRELSAHLRQVMSWALPSLAAVPLGLAKDAGAATAAVSANDVPDDRRSNLTLELPNRITGEERYAAHSSHASHSSHYSGSGGGGGGYYVPPAYVAPAAPPAPPPPPAPSTEACVTVDGAIMAMKVQLALKERKLYSGKIDGVMGPGTKAALVSFQKSQSLAQTGVMDNATLAKLGIVC